MLNENTINGNLQEITYASKNVRQRIQNPNVVA